MYTVHLNNTYDFDRQVQLTILVAQPGFVEAQYDAYHKKGLKNCKGSAFPLALEKSTEFNLEEHQAYYEYPLLRLP